MSSSPSRVAAVPAVRRRGRPAPAWAASRRPSSSPVRTRRRPRRRCAAPAAGARPGWWPPAGSSPRRGRRRGDHAQRLPDLEQVRVLEVVPANQVLPVLPGIEADPDQGVAGLDGVVAGARRVVVHRRLGRLGRRRRRRRAHRRAGGGDRRARRGHAVLDRGPVRRGGAADESECRSGDGHELQRPEGRDLDHAHGSVSCFIGKARILGGRSARPREPAGRSRPRAGRPPPAPARPRPARPARPAGRRRPAAPARPAGSVDPPAAAMMLS